jgi:hypothetical protein
MFPNMRLMIVAVLASIMGISCALGLFAEFRVSHDSFLRESNARAPLQLSAGGPPATVISAAATFGVRFAAQPSPPAADETVGSQIVDRTVAVDTPRATPSPGQKPEQVAAPAAPPTLAPEPAPEIATAPQPATPSATADAPLGAAGPVANGPNPRQNTAPGIQPEPKPADDKGADNKPAKTKPAETKPTETKPTETKSAETKPAESTPNGKADNKPADVTKPADNQADRTPAAALPAQEAAPTQKKSTPEAKLAPERAVASRKHATVRHRSLIVRRVPRTRAVAPTPSFTATQPLYQWTSPGQTVQPIRRRPVARRTRPIPKSAQTPQAAVSNSAANAPE